MNHIDGAVFNRGLKDVKFVKKNYKKQLRKIFSRLILLLNDLKIGQIIF